MPPTPRLTFRQVERVLVRNGFEFSHARSSHFYYRNPDGRIVTTVKHGNRVVPLGTMKSIMKQAGLPDSAWTRK